MLERNPKQTSAKRLQGAATPRIPFEQFVGAPPLGSSGAPRHLHDSDCR